MKNVRYTERTSKTMFHIYKFVNEVFPLYRRNIPLSGVNFDNGKYFVVNARSNNENSQVFNNEFSLYIEGTGH